MDNILEVQNLSASWNGVTVLQNVSLTLHAGELVCLTGPNGGGKSTLLTLLAGIKENGLTIDTADVYPSFNGRLLAKYESKKTSPQDNEQIQQKNLNHDKAKPYTRKEVATHISYLTQNETSAWNYKVRDVVLTGRFSHTNISGSYTSHDYEVVDSVLETLHITQLADRNIFSLSGGEFQKVRIARSLAQEPDMLLLDEPVANLDFGYQAELLSFIRDLAHGKKSTTTSGVNIPGVLVSIHDLNTAARFADTLVLLPKIDSQKIDESRDDNDSTKASATNQNQKMVTGKPEAILTPEVLQSIYGAKFGTFMHPEYGCVQVYTK